MSSPFQRKDQAFESTSQTEIVDALMSKETDLDDLRILLAANPRSAVDLLIFPNEAMNTTALHLAQNGETVRLIHQVAAEAGLPLDVDQTSANGLTALAQAASHGNEDVARALLEIGANPNATDSKPALRCALSILDDAVESETGKALQKVSKLTRLMMRLMRGPEHETKKASMVDLLITAGADADGGPLAARDPSMATPLVIACTHGLTDVAIKLAAAGANVSKSFNGRCPDECAEDAGEHLAAQHLRAWRQAVEANSAINAIRQARAISTSIRSHGATFSNFSQRVCA